MDTFVSLSTAAEAELLRCLECPTCQSVFMSPPIHYCERGHSVCSTCLKKIHRCGICRADFSHARNYSLESIVNILSLFKCHYEEAGCRERLRAADFQSHSEVCEFRPVSCDKCYTTQHISFLDFVPHLIETHNIEKWCTANRSFKVQSHVTSFKDCTWPVKCIQLGDSNEIFLKNERIFDGVYSIWITYFGSEKKATEFAATIIIRSEKLEAHQIKWKIAVHSFRRRIDDLEKHIHVLVPVEELETIALENNKTREWIVEYSINNSIPRTYGNTSYE